MPWPLSMYPIEYSVEDIAEDISPEPSTATVDAGQSIVDPTRSAPHFSGHAACRYCVMPLVVDDPYVRWCTVIGWPAGGAKPELTARIFAWSQVVMTPLKTSARMHAVMCTPAVGCAASGTLWKNAMAPSENGTWSTFTPAALSAS